MDSVTQAVFGAGIQGALLGRFQGRKALLYGAVIATLPDLDVFLAQEGFCIHVVFRIHQRCKVCWQGY